MAEIITLAVTIIVLVTLACIASYLYGKEAGFYEALRHEQQNKKESGI